MESEVYQEVLAREITLDELVFVRSWLDGRCARLPRDTPAFARGGATWLLRLRETALPILRGQHADYCFGDYIRALYLSQLRALAFPSVRSDRRKCQAAIVGAALSQRFLDDLDSGCYRGTNKGRPNWIVTRRPGCLPSRDFDGPCLQLLPRCPTSDREVGVSLCPIPRSDVAVPTAGTAAHARPSPEFRDTVRKLPGSSANWNTRVRIRGCTCKSRS